MGGRDDALRKDDVSVDIEMESYTENTFVSEVGPRDFDVEVEGAEVPVKEGTEGQEGEIKEDDEMMEVPENEGKDEK